MTKLRVNWQFANYQQTGVRSYDDDPRVMALPPLWDRSEVRKMLTFDPIYDEADRNLRAVQRIHSIKDAASLFQTLSMHLDLENHISTAMRRSLINFNPFKIGYYYKDVDTRVEMFQESMQSRQRMILSTHTLGGSLLGASGCGKTSGILSVLSLYTKPIILHTEFEGIGFFHTQVVYLYVKCPPRASPSSLCTAICRELDYQLGTNYVRRFCSKSRLNSDELMANVAHLILVHSLGILVIDDIQNLTSSGPGGKEVIMNFLVNLVDICRVACLVVGTYKALPIIVDQFSQIRRNAGTSETPFFNLLKKDSTELKVLMKSLWRYQYTRYKVPYSDELANVLFDETQGILDFIVKIYMLVQVRAISTGIETFDGDMIRSVAFDSLRLARETLKQLKNGNVEVLMEKDVKPIDLENHITSALNDMISDSQDEDKSDEKAPSDDEQDNTSQLPGEPEVLPQNKGQTLSMRTSGKHTPKTRKNGDLDIIGKAVSSAGYKPKVPRKQERGK